MTANAVTMDPMDPAISRGKSVIDVIVVDDFEDDDNNPSSLALVDDGDVDNILTAQLFRKQLAATVLVPLICTSNVCATKQNRSQTIRIVGIIHNAINNFEETPRFCVGV